MTNQELLKIYSAYLPYGVNCIAQGYNIDDFSDPVKPKKLELVGISDCKWCEIHEIGRSVTDQSYFEETYLLLRPLSDLTKEIEHNGERFYPIGKLHNSSYRRRGRVCKSEYEVNEMLSGMITTKKSSFSLGVEVDTNRVDNNKQWVINYLLKWHFDIFGLIDQNLAINLNEAE